MKNEYYDLSAKVREMRKVITDMQFIKWPILQFFC